MFESLLALLPVLTIFTICTAVVVLGCCAWAYLMFHVLVGGTTMPFLSQESPASNIVTSNIATPNSAGSNNILTSSLSTMPAMQREQRQMPEAMPILSVIIAACNEESSIKEALTSLLATDYPHLEIIVVNDRSHDRTGDIINQCAERDTRIKPLHIAALPEGWLGKVHALHTGVQIAQGDFFLFTDADVHFAPQCFQRAVEYMAAHELDHLTLMPKIRIPLRLNGLDAFLSATLVAAFAILFLFGIRPQKIATPDPKRYAGVGAFNLVRRSAFQRTQGFEWLRMEVIDDVGLGLMMKRSGARCGIANGVDLLHLEWYPSFHAMMRGFEKNFFAGFGQYRWSIALWRVMQLLGIVCLPWCAALLAVIASLPDARNALLLVSLLFSVHIAIPYCYALVVRQTIPVAPFAFAALPIGLALMALAILRSAFVVTKRDGIEWRGTLYSLRDLRMRQRVKLGE